MGVQPMPGTFRVSAIVSTAPTSSVCIVSTKNRFVL